MDAGVGQVIVGVPGVDVPLSRILCDVYPGPGALRLLSDSTREPVRAPATVGVELMDNTQDAPAANVPGSGELLLTTGQVLVALLLRLKFVATLGLLSAVGIGRVRSTLPMFSTVTVRGLSGLVNPTDVVAKFRLGGAAKYSFSTLSKYCSEMKRVPSPLTAIPAGCCKETI